MTDKAAPYDLAGKRVWVAGHNGMVGSAICRQLETEPCDLITASRSELDLCQQSQVDEWMAENKPQAIFFAAAKVGGIDANRTYPADFIYDNLMIETNIIHTAYKYEVEKLLFLGSSCIYPGKTTQPIKEEALLTGLLEPTNEAYAIAKIAGIKLVQAYRTQYGCDFISAMPTNLYGKNDKFDLQTSHVIPALIAKAHQAKSAGDGVMDVWGTGRPRRDFLYVDDAAEALVHLLKTYSGEGHINVGAGRDISIKELATMICDVVGFEGELRFQTEMPDGTLLKKLDTSRLKELGWEVKTGLRDGLEKTYAWYQTTLA